MGAQTLPCLQATLSFLTRVDPRPSLTPFLGGVDHREERHLFVSCCGCVLGKALPSLGLSFPVCTASALDGKTLLVSGAAAGCAGMAKVTLGISGQKDLSCNVAMSPPGGSSPVNIYSWTARWGGNWMCRFRGTWKEISSR